MNCPKSLFQYCPSSGTKILADLKIKVTPPNKLNDPFEMSPIVRTKDIGEKARQRFKNSVTNSTFFDENRLWFSLNFPQLTSFRKYQKFARANAAELIEVFKKEIPKIDQELQEQILDRISDLLGVVCFSKNPTHPLMWAHYADKHEGLAIEFDTQSPFFQTQDFIEVEYHGERAEFEPSQHEKSREQIEVFSKRKSPHWDHEEEMRLVVHLDKTTIQRTEKGDIRLLQIPSSLIKSVTFGARTKREVREEVQRLLIRPNLQHVRLWEILTDELKYEFCRREVASL